MAMEDSGDRDLVELVLRAAHQSPATTAAEDIAQLVADPPNEAPGPVGDMLLDFVVGARALRERLADLEVEAGIQARAAGITVRQMSAATGIADRNVRLPYRREDSPAPATGKMSSEEMSTSHRHLPVDYCAGAGA